MSILNVLLTPNQLVVVVDTLAEDARTGAHSAGAKLLLIPQHNLVLATRGSTQFFLRIYELALQASFRADFTMEQLTAELGLVIDRLWPNYEKAAVEAGLPLEQLGTELVLGGWSPKSGRMVATAYAKSDTSRKTLVQPLEGAWLRPEIRWLAGRIALPKPICSQPEGSKPLGSTAGWGERWLAADCWLGICRKRRQ